mmetsp:Transcript_20884/g.31720  ORF Transcript_20884/g.31720 Transcript_20884/m.31720 type:complete len:614 (-) Transcript_20884:30-1871(-)
MRLETKALLVSTLALISNLSQNVLGLEIATLTSDFNATSFSSMASTPLTYNDRVTRNVFDSEEEEREWVDSDDDANTKQANAQRNPNILIIMADDVGTGDIPFYWKSGLVKMPNISRLADRGVKFTDAYATPLCSPSRYSLLSGNFQHRGQKPGGTWNLGSDRNQFAHDQVSIAQVLRDKGGYKTHMAGKWHIGAKVHRFNNALLDYDKVLTSRDHDWSRPLEQGPQDIGFDESLISVCGIQAKPYAMFRDGLLQTKIADVKFWKKGSYNQPKGESIIQRQGEGDPDWDSTAYNQNVVEDTIAFIDKQVKNNPNQPFMSYASLGAVHGPHSPPDTYLDGTPIKGEYDTPHMDMLLEMDLAVGSLVDAIDSRGLASNTLIIFTSDNGGVRPSNGSTEFAHYSSGPLRDAKGSIYEGGTRVPMVISWPGTVAEGATRSSKYVGLNDIYATLTEIAGVTIPSGSAQDSISFANYLVKNDETNLRKWMPTWVYDPQSGMRLAEAVRRKNMKVIRFIDPATGAKYQELYDLDADPSETTDLSKDPRYKKKKRKMLRKLRKLGPCPGQRKWPFQLQNGPQVGVQVTCDFFDTQSKCNEYLDGELNCPTQCSRRQKQCSV